MKRLISICVSLIILLIIYWKIDFQNLVQVLQNCNWWWMFISQIIVVPIVAIAAWRLQQLTPTGKGLKFGEANRLILAASVLNLILPSRLGDIAKAYFMKDKGHLSGELALSLVVFEKASDLLALLMWCLFGLIIYPQKNQLFAVMTVAVAVGVVGGLLLLGSRKFAQIFFLISKAIVPKKIKFKIDQLQIAWGRMHDYFWGDKIQLAKISIAGIFLWFVNLLQIWFFILTLNAWTPLLDNLALAPLAILAGLLPLTFAGVGTRDAAFIIFYQPYFDASTGAALGILCMSRYLVPALGGLPFLGQYLTAIRGMNEKKFNSSDVE